MGKQSRFRVPAVWGGFEILIRLSASGITSGIRWKADLGVATWASINSQGVAALCLGLSKVCDSRLSRQQEVAHKCLPLGQVEGASRGHVVLRKQVPRGLPGSPEQLSVEDLCGLAAGLMTNAWLHACGS